MEIWHLALADNWDAAVATGSYCASTLGRTVDEVGYIHCSHPHQAPSVAARFYADVTASLRVLAMDDDRVRACGVEVKYEDSGAGELFPHIYGEIDPAWVHEVLPAHMTDGQLVIDGRDGPSL
ncbi:MAG: DUF952 domain-containing protein [Actinobacteria bacterium HGW-Actinobacteria-8]|nr:MAG: DUF952 domain-containing protein [Actinobacteria bacterium HGW-Actinobacteria-8]